MIGGRTCGDRALKSDLKSALKSGALGAHANRVRPRALRIDTARVQRELQGVGRSPTGKLAVRIGRSVPAVIRRSLEFVRNAASQGRAKRACLDRRVIIWIATDGERAARAMTVLDRSAFTAVRGGQSRSRCAR